MSFVDRALSRATSFKPGRVALLVVSSPFYVVGALVGLLVVVCVVVAKVTAQGFEDARGLS